MASGENKNANADVTSNSRMDLGNVVASAAASGLSPDYYDDASIEDFVSEARGMPEYTMARRKKVLIFWRYLVVHFNWIFLGYHHGTNG